MRWPRLGSGLLLAAAAFTATLMAVSWRWILPQPTHSDRPRSPAAAAAAATAAAARDGGAWIIDAHCHVSKAMHTPFVGVMNATGVRFAISHGTWRGFAYDLATVRAAREHYSDRYAALYAPTWGSSDSDYFKGTATEPVVVTDEYLATTLPDEIRQFVAAGGPNALGLKFWRDVGTRLVDSTGARFRLVDPRLDPALEVVRSHGLVVSIHACGQHRCRADLNAFLARHRGRLKITLAHWGGLAANLTALGSLLRDHPDVLLDLSPAPSWPKAPADALAAFVRTFQDRIAFGTDFVEANRAQCCNHNWWACWYSAFRRYYETNATVALPCIPRWQGVWGIHVDDAAVLHKVYWANAYRFYGLHRLLNVQAPTHV